MTREELQDRFLGLMEEDQHDPQVQYEIGRCYLLGEGVEKNGEEAERWLKLAADQGQTEAIALLESVREQREQEAFVTEESLPDWCMRAEDGDAEAQYQVADYFLNTDLPGTAEDAERYLLAAVEQGHPQACLLLGRQKLEAGQSAEALQLLRNAADCGLPEAMELLAQCYSEGAGGLQDAEQAEKWFAAAAEQGDAMAMVQLAVRYQLGDGVPLSPGKAMTWIKRAQDSGMADAREQAELQLELLRSMREKERMEREAAEAARKTEEAARRQEEYRRLQELEAAEAARKKEEAARQAEEQQRQAKLQAEEAARREEEQKRLREQQEKEARELQLRQQREEEEKTKEAKARYARRNKLLIYFVYGPALAGLLVNLLHGHPVMGALTAVVEAVLLWYAVMESPISLPCVGVGFYAYYVGRLLRVSTTGCQSLLVLGVLVGFLAERYLQNKGKKQ